MSPWRFLLGPAIPNRQAEGQKIGPLAGVPVLGLDALASAAYGPEAALTVLLVLGAAGVHFIGPLVGLIAVLLLVVQLSYRQTIAAYPGGGGSYTVAHANLGLRPGLLAAAALALDYVLNVAVAISAGVGALVSAFPALFPFMLPLCLGLLVLLTLVNLRGVRTAGRLFMLPTYLFVACLGVAILVGLFHLVRSGGHPTPVVAPPPLPPATAGASLWLLAHAFANGCTAMTGVEAVSNGTPLFREPRVKGAQRTLSSIVVVLVLLLIGVALLCHAYGIGATPPGQAGFQSVLSQLIAAVAGRGVFYFVSIAAIVCVLCLSANTSFADFPRLGRVLALDGNLPAAFAHLGRRLVYSTGVLILALLSGALLVAFHGVTDHLIPLFAVGALSAFTLSQAGMVAHWRKQQGRHARRAQWVNAVGAVSTGLTLVVVVAAKFREGAWLSLVFIPLCYLLFARTHRHYQVVDAAIATDRPIDASPIVPPLVVVPLKRLDRVSEKALRIGLSLSPEVEAVQVRAQPFELEDLKAHWEREVGEPLRRAGLPEPRLVVLPSENRQLIEPLLDYLHALSRDRPDRFIGVLVPELIERHWYHYFLHGHTATVLKMELLFRGGPKVFIVNTPWYLRSQCMQRRRDYISSSSLPRVSLRQVAAKTSERTAKKV